MACVTYMADVHLDIEIKANMYTVYIPAIYTYIFTLNLVSALGILEELIFPCLLPTESPGG